MDTIKQRQEEATSDETLEELEDEEFLKEEEADQTGSGPSPDGAFAEDDDLKDAELL